MVLQSKSVQTAADVSRETVSMALPLDRGRTGERSKQKVGKPLQTCRGSICVSIGGLQLYWKALYTYTFKGRRRPWRIPITKMVLTGVYIYI